MKKTKTYNLIISGVGGQGQITLKKILCQAAINQGLDFKASELHGLAQKGGSVVIHFRTGKKVYSSLISQGKADLILGLDLMEAARAIKFGSKNTELVVNNLFIPFFKQPQFSEKDLLKLVKDKVKKVNLVPASKICKEKLGNEIYAGVFLLGYLAKIKSFPLKKASLISGIRKILSKKNLSINLKAFKLGNLYENGIKRVKT